MTPHEPMSHIRRLLLSLCLSLAACGDDGSTDISEDGSVERDGGDVDGGSGDGGARSDGAIDPLTYRVGGELTGLIDGALVLELDGQVLELTTNGTFAFPTPLEEDTAVSVDITAQPIGQSCAIEAAPTTVDASAPDSVLVSCTPNAYDLELALVGYEGEGLVVSVDATTYVVPSGATRYATGDTVLYGDDVEAAVVTQPTAPVAECSVAPESATVGAEPLILTVTCGSPIELSGTISGLEAGSRITVRDAESGQTFDVHSGQESYVVTGLFIDGASFDFELVGPPGYTCTFSDDPGVFDGDTVSNIACTLAPAGGGDGNESGLQWMGFVERPASVMPQDADPSATCDFSSDTIRYQDCSHLGALRAFPIPGQSSCAGLRAADSEDAFRWVCDESTDPVTFRAVELRSGMGLRDLIDFGAPGALPPLWKKMTLSAFDATDTRVHESTPLQWWVNPLITVSSAELTGAVGDLVLDREGAIFVIREVPSAGSDKVIRLLASRSALLGAPAVTLAPSAALEAAENDFIFLGPGGTSNSAFQWFELDVDSGGMRTGVVTAIRSWFLTMRNASFRAGPVTESRSGTGLTVRNRASLYENLLLSPARLSVVRGSFNTFRDLFVAHGGSSIAMSNASTGQNVFIDTVINNTGSSGSALFVNLPRRNVFIRTRIVAADREALRLRSAIASVFLGLTVAYAEDGVEVRATAVTGETGRIVLKNAVSAFHLGNGIVFVDDPEDNYFEGIAALDNGEFGLAGDTVLDVDALFGGAVPDFEQNPEIGGPIVLGHNGLADCAASAGNVRTDPGDGSCVFEDPSASPVTGQSAADAFVGYTGRTETFGPAFAGPIDDPDMLWVRASSEAEPRGACFDDARGTPTCEVYDLRLRETDTTLRERNPTFPTGDDIYAVEVSRRATFGPAVPDCDDFVPGSEAFQVAGDETTDTADDEYWCVARYLRDASEVVGDYVGNENGLCESGERCVFMPNLGAYQGHGPLLPVHTIGTGGTLENIELLQFEQNGVP